VGVTEGCEVRAGAGEEPVGEAGSAAVSALVVTRAADWAGSWLASQRLRCGQRGPAGLSSRAHGSSRSAVSQSPVAPSSGAEGHGHRRRLRLCRRAAGARRPAAGRRPTENAARTGTIARAAAAAATPAELPRAAQSPPRPGPAQRGGPMAPRPLGPGWRRRAAPGAC
jgi:hypothetical protein